MHVFLALLLFFCFACSSSTPSLSCSLPLTNKKEDPQKEKQKQGEYLLLQCFLKDQDLVIDVGAHRGSWIKKLLSIKPHSSIIGIEPIPEVFARLKKDLHTHTYSLHNLALSNHMGQGTLFFYNKSWSASKGSGFYKKMEEIQDEPTPILVKQDTLDHFCFCQDIEKISLLHIDAEGAEMKILQGSENLLKEKRIKGILLTHHPVYEQDCSFKELVRLLTDCNYILFQIEGEGLVHLSQWEEKLEKEDGRYFALLSSEIPDFLPMHF